MLNTRLHHRAGHLHPVPGAGHAGQRLAHGDGHDDGAADDRVAALQVAALRRRRRLGADHHSPRGFLRGRWLADEHRENDGRASIAGSASDRGGSPPAPRKASNLERKSTTYKSNKDYENSSLFKWKKIHV